MEIDWLATTVIAVTGAVTALGSVLAVRGSARTSKAQFFIELTDRYNSKKMGDALFGLTQFYLKHPDDFAQLFASTFNRRDAQSVQIDEYRRTVNRYFTNIAQMYEAGLIDRRFARMVTNFYGLNTYYRLVVPMNEAKYGPDHHIPSVLRRIRKRYRKGEIVQHLPGRAS